MTVGHNTVNCYTVERCRRPECVQRWQAYWRDYRSRPADPARCGTPMNYLRGCRCPSCARASNGENRYQAGHPTALLIAGR